MSAISVIAIFDVGKTNKKLFLFDETYKIVYEKSARFSETVDEDGFPCENIEILRLSVFDSLNEVFSLKQFNIKAVNFSAYGASFVYIDEQGNPVAPLYNYLKPFPTELSDQLYKKYGGAEKFSIQTASPILGNLNSGLQLYRLKQEKPEIFSKVKYALHLPQYLSFLLTGKCYSDLTSLGCHTAMWDFEKDRYHEWVQHEGMSLKLAPIENAKRTLGSIIPGARFKIGIGLHDSSAALIPYLVNFSEPFILISTGTWCISLNPFNKLPLTAGELNQDCMQYLQYQGQPVKASRLFSGSMHEQQVKRIAGYFKDEHSNFRNVAFDGEINSTIHSKFRQDLNFEDRPLSAFSHALEAYHQLMRDLIRLQTASTKLILQNTPVKRIFVDGGFSKNSVFMHLLAASFPRMEVFAASMAQASAVGAALTIHSKWNSKPVPTDIIQLNYYSANQTIAL
jgi:sugar (pentulose or hexulose) kinase